MSHAGKSHMLKKFQFAKIMRQLWVNINSCYHFLINIDM